MPVLVRTLVASCAALLLAACGSSASLPTSQTSASTVVDTDVWVTTPASTTFQASPGTQQELFEGDFTAQDGQTRIVASLVTPTDPSGRVYVGQEVGCRSPSGTFTKTPLSGRNVSGSGPQVPILSALILTTDEAGTWTCGSTVDVCVPGSCKEPGPSATVSILTESAAPTGYSVLAVSTPVPDWAEQVRPGTDNLVIAPGDSQTWSAELSLPPNVDAVGLAGTVSLTNCITATYPSDCAGVGPHDVQGNAVVAPAVLVTQLTSDGAACSTYALTEKDGISSRLTITWEEHHSQIAFIVRALNPSTEAGCTRDFRVDLTFSVRKGNSVVVERGTAAAPASLVIVTPPLPNLILSEIDISGS